MFHGVLSVKYAEVTGGKSPDGSAQCVKGGKFSRN